VGGHPNASAFPALVRNPAARGKERTRHAVSVRLPSRRVNNEWEGVAADHWERHFLPGRYGHLSDVGREHPDHAPAHFSRSPYAIVLDAVEAVADGFGNALATHVGLIAVDLDPLDVRQRKGDGG